MDIQQYYNNHGTQSRIRNFMAGSSWFLVAGSQFSRDPSWGRDPPVRVFTINELEHRLGTGPDVFRPLTGGRGVLGVFDLEYYNWDKMTLFKSKDGSIGNFDVHDDIFKFELEPVYQSVKKNFGNEALFDITWSGYHVLTEIDRGSPVYNQLLSLGWDRSCEMKPRCLEDTLISKYQSTDKRDIKREFPISLEDGVVYNQFGRVIEYLCRKVMKDVKSTINPVTLCDTDETCLSLDISQYADPVFMRIIRTAFSSWDKHNMTPSISEAIRMPPMLDVVRKYGDFETDELDFLFSCQRDYQNSMDYHRMFSGFIPSAGQRVSELVSEYAQSDLRRFHQDFDSVSHDPTDENYKRAKFDHNIPFEIREMMEYPNPSFLQPHNLRRVCAELVDKGWHPKHIGGMLAGRYLAHDKGWKENMWTKYDANTRANFWARIYCGLALVK